MLPPVGLENTIGTFFSALRSAMDRFSFSFFGKTCTSPSGVQACYSDLSTELRADTSDAKCTVSPLIAATFCPLAARRGTSRPNGAFDCSHPCLELVT